MMPSCPKPIYDLSVGLDKIVTFMTHLRNNIIMDRIYVNELLYKDFIYLVIGD